MAGSALAPILGTMFSTGAAAGAAGSAFAGIGWKLAGGVLAGWGKAKLEEKMMDKKEEQQIAEERRRQATYEGAGDAVRFWDNPEDDNNLKQGQQYERADAQEGYAAPVGEQYRMPAPKQAARFRYDETTGKIVQV